MRVVSLLRNITYPEFYDKRQTQTQIEAETRNFSIIVSCSYELSLHLAMYQSYDSHPGCDAVQINP